MKLREVKFRDAVKVPGSGSQFETVMRSDSYDLVHDVPLRIIVIGHGGRVISVPIENVVYMEPDVETPAVRAAAASVEAALANMPAPVKFGHKRRS